MEYYGIKKNFQFVSKYIDICKNFYIYTCIYKVSNNRGKNGEKIQSARSLFQRLPFHFISQKSITGLLRS